MISCCHWGLFAAPSEWLLVMSNPEPEWRADETAWWLSFPGESYRLRHRPFGWAA